jgi:hypothetical protein
VVTLNLLKLIFYARLRGHCPILSINRHETCF